MMHAPDSVPRWGDEWRAGVAAFSHIHHLFLPRAARALAFIWRKASTEAEVGLRGPLLFFVEQAIVGMSLLNRYAPSHFSQVNRVMSGRIRLTTPLIFLPSRSCAVSSRFTGQGCDPE
jgi:hypothetical protein